MSVPAYTATDAEREAVRLINQTRAKAGRHSLMFDARLCYWAAWHTRAMEAKRTIFHSTSQQLTNYANSVGRWRVFGENVGATPATSGDEVVALHKAFVASPHHYYNIVLPAYTRVGIGIRSLGGITYETQLFWG